MLSWRRRTTMISVVFGRHNIDHHLFADDKHGVRQHLTGRPSVVCAVDYVIVPPTSATANWCASRQLQLNENKIELAWFGKQSRLTNLLTWSRRWPSSGASVIQPAAAVRDLDQNSAWLFILLSTPLQRIQNATARLILDLRMNEHQLWGSSTSCPSTVEWTSNCAPWCTQSTPVSVRRILPTWCVPSPSTRWGPVCDPPTRLNTLSRVDRQAWVLIRRFSRLERSSTVTPLYHWLETF